MQRNPDEQGRGQGVETLGFGGLLRLLSRIPVRQRRWMGRVVFLGGVGLSLWGARYVHLSQSREVWRTFDRSCDQVQVGLEGRFKLYAEALYGLRSFLETTPGLDRATFNRYCTSLQLQARLPGLRGITYGRHVPVEAQASFLRTMQAQWPAAELGRPFTFRPATPTQDAYIVVYGHPEAANLGAIGYNSASRAEQMDSLLETLRSREIVASGALDLAQAPGEGPGIILRLAVAAPEGPGYINLAFVVSSLMEATLEGMPGQRLGLVVEDTAHGAPAALFRRQGRHGDTEYLLGRALTSHRTVTFRGGTWRVRVFSEGGLVTAAHRWLPLTLFLGGSALGLMLAGLISSLDRMEAWAARRARHLVEHAAAREAHLAAITRVLPDLVLVLDQDGLLLEVLGGQAIRLGGPGGIQAGQPMASQLPVPLVRQLQKDLARCLEEGDVVACQLALDLEGRSLHVEGRMAPALFSHGGRDCAVWVGRDVTAQRTEEARLREVQKLESLGLLASGIAHDFNNLLSALRMNLTLAREDAAAGQPMEEYLDAAETSITAASDLARQMMIYAGQGGQGSEAVDLLTLVRDMARLLQASVNRRTPVTWDLPETLPALVGDRAQLRQVILNLVVNASDAMAGRPGGIRVSLQAATVAPPPTGREVLPPPSGPVLMLEVQDQGCGMGPDTLDRIFDPFFTTKADGRGLGLSAMIGILRAHEAGLAVHSVPDQGTTFQVAFPTAPAREEAQS